MNPYETKKESAVYSGQGAYDTADKWEDMDELELCVEGPHLILGSITFSAYNGANVGFRLTNTIPLRPKTNQRIPVQFSVEAQIGNLEENLCTISFHVVAHCRGVVKLQVITSGAHAYIYVNMLHHTIINKPYDHKTISTLSAIPLCGAIKQKNNVVRQPTRRSAPASIEEESVKIVPKNPDKPISKNFKISSSSGTPPQ